MRKATAFRGRSEQDRSALCAGCCALVLKTFRWNVFNGFPFAEIGGHGTPCPNRGCCETASCFLCYRRLRLQCPTGTLQRSCFSSPVSHGERSCSLPAKSCRFLSLSPCAKSMAQGISPSADGDLGGSSPPKNLPPAALSWSSLTNLTIPILFVSARWLSLF